MSLETLLEAARYVEQQELRAKQQLQQLQHQPPHVNNHQVPRPRPRPSPTAAAPFKIVSPVPITTHSSLTASNQHPQLSQSPPAALVAVPHILPHVITPQPQQPHSLVAATTSPTNGVTITTPRTPGQQLTQVQNTAVMMLPGLQPSVVEMVSKPQPITVQPSQHPLTNGVKPAAVIIDENHQQQPQQQSQQHSQQQDLKKRSHVPSVIRSGTREVHNKLEKNRRAHLKECFELLKKQLPPQQDEKKSSNLSILHSALKYIQILKKKEREYEHEMERLAREKISAQQRLASLKKEVGAQWDNIDFNAIIPDQAVSSALTTTTSIVTMKEERTSDSDESNRITNATPLQPTQLSVHLPLQQVGYPVGQGLVVGLHKVALVSKSLPLVHTSPVTHIITAPPQLNGKVVPLVNAQYVMKPVVVVSTPSAATATTISPRPS